MLLEVQVLDFLLLHNQKELIFLYYRIFICSSLKYSKIFPIKQSKGAVKKYIQINGSEWFNAGGGSVSLARLDEKNIGKWSKGYGVMLKRSWF